MRVPMGIAAFVAGLPVVGLITIEDKTLPAILIVGCSVVLIAGTLSGALN